MVRSRSLRPLALLLSLLCTLALACGDDGGGEDPPTDDGDNNPVGVRLINALSDGTTLNAVFRDQAGQNIEHNGLSDLGVSDYLDIPAGIYTVIFFDAATSQPLSDLTIENLNVEADSTRTLIISVAPGGDQRVTQIPDDLSPPSENQANIRFIHQANAVGVDIYNDANGIRLATRIQHGQLTTYAGLPAGNYTFNVFEQDTVADPILPLDGVTLLPANVYTILLVGSQDPNEDGDTSDSTFQAIQITDSSFQ